MAELAGRVVWCLGAYAVVATIALAWALPLLRANDEAFPVWPGALPGKEQD